MSSTTPGERPVRTQLYWDLHDFSRGRGFELGPLMNPIVTREEADVTYVDVFSTEQLRELYAGDPGIDVTRLVPVDVALGRPNGAASLSEALSGHGLFDWAMASHVIEHVPDLIGWLVDVADVVVDGGILVLAVPDKRYTFDIHRQLTTTGEMLAAHEAGHRRPATRAVYDHCRTSVTVDLAALWNGADPPDFRARMYTEDEVVKNVARARAGEYLDTHVWVFTPDSFHQQLHELRQLGELSWTVDRLIETPPLNHEFRVRLRRIPRGADVRAPQPGEVVPEMNVPAWQRERLELVQALTSARGEVAAATARAARAEARLLRVRARLDRVRARAAKARQRNARLRAKVERLRKANRTLRG